MPVSSIVPIGTVTVGMPRWRIAKFPLATQTPLRQPRVGRRHVDVHVRGTDIRNRGENDRVQAESVHPLLEVDTPRLLEPAHTLLQMRDLKK